MEELGAFPQQGSGSKLSPVGLQEPRGEMFLFGQELEAFYLRQWWFIEDLKESLSKVTLYGLLYFFFAELDKKVDTTLVFLW